MSRRRQKKEERKKGAALTVVQPEPEVLAAQAETHVVTLIKDHNVAFPELWMNVFFSVEGHEGAFGELFARAKCGLAKSIDEADLVVFPGGADVSPSLYGGDKHHETRCNPARDELEIKVYAECVNKGIPMFGVCRGLQFLHVMNGGKLFQHVDKHNSSHWMSDLTTKEYFDNVSSTHHQQVKPSNNVEMEVLATSVGVSSFRYDGPLTRDTGSNADIEAVFYPQTCCLGVQGHPEYRGYSRYAAWCLRKIQDKIVHNVHVKAQRVDGSKSVGSVYRFARPEVITIN